MTPIRAPPRMDDRSRSTPRPITNMSTVPPSPIPPPSVSPKTPQQPTQHLEDRSRSSPRDRSNHLIDSIRPHILRIVSPILRSRSPHRQPQTPAKATGGSSPTIYYPSPKSAGSLASTIPYPAEEEPAPAAPMPTKRDAPTPDTVQKDKAQRLQSPSPVNNTGARSSNDGAPVLPFQDSEDDEDDQERQDRAALVLWAEEIEAEIKLQERGLSADASFERAYASLPKELHDVITKVAATEEITKIEIGFEGSMAKCHEMGASITDGDILAFEVTEGGAKAKTIVRETGALTKDEEKTHKVKVDASKLKEIKGLVELGCFKRRPKRGAFNVVDTRWVITWKMIDKVLQIKCRLTMRGFKDRQSDIETFAGTTSRAGQRVVNTVVAQEDDFVLFSFDVSQAFAKGLTFEEFARLTGQELRSVQFRLAPEDVPLLRHLPGFEDFDPDTEVLEMLKPIYGLKDAPRAWRKRLHQALVRFGANPLLAEPEIYVQHVPLTKQEKEAIEKSWRTAVTHDRISTLRKREEAAAAERQQPSQHQNWLAAHRRKLTLIVSTHVDDLKGGARKEVAQELLKFLEAEFGECKKEYDNFTHCGVIHERRADGVFNHQWPYAAALQPIPLARGSGADDGQPVSEEMHTLFQSLLGGAAWLVLTRADVSIYIQALQRKQAKPYVGDVRRLNIVVRFVQRHKVGVLYPKIRSTL